MLNRASNINNIALIAFIVTSLMLAACTTTNAQSAVTPPGIGSQTDPYLVSELGHLVWMGDTVANSNGKYYSMTADIDASATATWNDAGTDDTILEGFRPIGSSAAPFTGIFEGNGHTISGLVINRPSTYYIGLFGNVDRSGQVRNLSIVKCTTLGQGAVGILIGKNTGIVSNCSTTGTVRGMQSFVGGLVGCNYTSSGLISNSYAAVAVIGSDNLGGLVGYSQSGTVSNCCASGTVTTTGSYAGGLIGYLYAGTVRDCYSSGEILKSSSSTYVGGLIGYTLYSIVSGSYWDTQTSKYSTSAAGIGKSTADMKMQDTFAGWDFSAIWSIVEGITYPYLSFSPPPFMLSINVTGSGNVILDPASPDGTYAAGTVVTLRPIQGVDSSVFSRWIGTGSIYPVATTVVMDNNKSVTAEFKQGIAVDSLTTLAKIGNDPAYPLSGIYSLTTDIDASPTTSWNDADTGNDVLEGFKPIGKDYNVAFSGIFEGNGHTVSGLSINRPNLSNVGLFGCIYPNAQVRNLGIVGGRVTGNNTVGGMIGKIHDSMILNCFSTATVTGSSEVGGLAGFHVGIMLNCYATGAASGTGSRIGGLIGISDGRVLNSYAAGAVSGSGSYIGGLIGRNQDIVSNSYWDMQTTGQNTSQGGTVKTSAQMKQQATFIDWDFTTMWGIGENVTYPYLRSLDADGDGVGNGSDACADTPPGTLVSLSGCPTAAADLNLDGDVDQADLDLFTACFTGPQVPMTPDCENRDLDSDGDVDQSDFGILQRCYSGENAPADPGCN